MPNPICPLCGQTLAIGASPWRCPNGHCFDVARQGYVNLLPVQQKHARHPGDTPAQVAARKRFLDAGFYAPIRDTALALLQPHLPPGPACWTPDAARAITAPPWPRRCTPSSGASISPRTRCATPPSAIAPGIGSPPVRPICPSQGAALMPFSVSSP